MRATKAVLVVVLMISFCLPARAQSSRIDGGVSSRSKFGFYWETRLEPPTPPLAEFSSATTATTGSEIIYRIMQDRSRKICFGYRAQVEVLPEPNTYRVTFRELGLTPQEALNFFFHSDDPSGWTVLSTPGWGLGAPQTVRGGDVVELNLLTNSATNQRIVDYVTIQEPARGQPVTFGNVNTPPREFAFATGSPRDFRSDDAELRIRAPRLSINGKLDPTTTGTNFEISGPVVWIYVPNRGRFVLSLMPHPDLGFRKAGEVRGSSLTIRDGPDTLSLVAGAPITSTQAAFNLYVFHDPAWKPAYAFANLSAFNMGAADRAELLIRK
jgi:hypothetical protein